MLARLVGVGTILSLVLTSSLSCQKSSTIDLSCVQRIATDCSDGFNPEASSADSCTDATSDGCRTKDGCVYRCVPAKGCGADGTTRCAGTSEVLQCQGTTWVRKEDCTLLGRNALCVASADGSAGCERCPSQDETRCDGLGCRDLRADPANCGACGLKCPSSGPNSHPVCQAGICATKCDDGFSSCDGSCVEALSSNIDHCGACGIACGSKNGVAVCSQGVCKPQCRSGFAHCTQRPSDGCETDVSTRQDCGVCGRTCRLSEECVSGSCSPCEERGLRTCGTGSSERCVNSQSDPLNCGDCGISCPGGSSARCIAGQCISWPFGKDTLVVKNGQTVTLPAGSVSDFSLLQVDAGGTLVIGSGIGWTFIGVRGQAIVNGKIVGHGGEHAGGTFATNTPDDNGTLVGPAIAATLLQSAGGRGASSGWPCAAGKYYRGGTEAFGNGGGGAGDTMGDGSASRCPFCDNVYQGFNGFPALVDAAGRGGADWNSVANTNGGAGATTYGGAGANGITVGAYAGRSGGGGGFRGRHGSLLYWKMVGSIGGAGSINLSGETGGSGGSGGLSNTISNQNACAPTRFETGGGSGGGGGGGSGGTLLMRYRGTIGLIVTNAIVSGGAGGSAGPAIGGNPDGEAGQPGQAGLVDAQPF